MASGRWRADTHLVKPISLFLYAQRTDLLFCCMFIDEKIWCRYTMASLDRSPTTTKKLRFFSSSPLRMSAGIRESLARMELETKTKGLRVRHGGLTLLCGSCWRTIWRVGAQDLALHEIHFL